MTRIEVTVSLMLLDGKWVGRVRRDNYARQQPRPHGTREDAERWIADTLPEALRDKEDSAA